MDLQTFIVAVIIAAALLYMARRALMKTRSFTKKSNCGTDCGCDK